MHRQSKPSGWRLVEAGLTVAFLLSTAATAAETTASELPFVFNSGQYSRYKPLSEYSRPPSRCTVEQVIVLQRGGASLPDSKLGTSIQASLAKVVGKGNYSRTEMDFLGNYTFDMGSNGALLPYGEAQSKQAGVQVRKRYCHSKGLTESECANYWISTTDSSALIDSAKNWANGLMEGTGKSTRSPRIIPEGDHLNNTLAAKCPKLVSSVPSAQQQWRDVWTPAVIQRLQSGQSYGLNSTDIINFAHLCALESLATSDLSPFCDLFYPSEWSSIEYDADLEKYYSHSYGAPLSRSLAVGYLHELLTRLTKSPSFVEKDRTTVNNTSDARESTFPLDRSLYLDFTSDDQLLALLTLLNLFHDAPLSPTLPCPMRSFVTSRLIPFGASLVVERLACSGNGFWDDLAAKFSGLPTRFVRVVVNDRVMNLAGICPEDELAESDTICRLVAFHKSLTPTLQEATKEFARCAYVPANLWEGLPRKKFQSGLGI
ncbi:BZ3500_MvSof-1268-A1-R1_Chr3-1g06132 [Microbotryum saponariae]|uniref:BZ3500_MvSof-1268-A1-R1_Chr3-1g06132 protein n=1 Tax=Microbotryum saponariae TaxID=289078 RepID=A0A2X0M4F3_9BASI|nr:BZ3500_MvSof-1268-A1-R1_Chr3-1g06132 [Microbotryum saponariae]SDA03995.1 BZ3501_MvSof-1269-A2-R1_Chr3-2g05817 [Microbotryum saponariae]